MPEAKLRKIALAYIAVQAIIWAKSIAFFLWFGHGKAMQFSASAFPPSALAFDFWFHESMHAAIAALALLFGKNLHKTGLPKLAALLLIAAALHNSAYWFTATHPSIEYSAIDFARDLALLFAFVAAGHAIGKMPQWLRNAKQHKV